MTRHVYTQGAFFMKFKFSPWPQSKDRKLQIGPRVPQGDRSRGMGVQHYTADSQQAMDDMRNEFLAKQCFDMHDLKAVNSHTYAAYQDAVNPRHPSYV